MKMDKAAKEAIRKHAIKNAIDYGKAKLENVIGKAIKELPGIPVPEIKTEVQAAVDAVNAMSAAELEKEYAPFKETFEQKAKEKIEKTAKPTMAIEGAEEGKVVTRFPPEPGGYMTIGNSKQCLLSEEFAKIYKGKVYLYFDDTNPEKCKQEYVDGMKRDTAWLGVRFDKEYYASDFIEKVYDCGRKLMQKNDAYVCLCGGDEVKKNRLAMVECKHRLQAAEQNLSLFDDMLKGKYEEGLAIVRFKGDMASDNSAFRDPTLFRIKKTKHYRQGEKYVVWPTYHINTLVVDNLNGVTDAIRDKNYEIWDGVHRKILADLGLKPPRFLYEARLNIKGAAAGKRVLRKLVKEGMVAGWDDPRLTTIVALKRRGIQPEAIRSFVLRFGMSKVDSMVSMDMLLAENKKLIDPIAKHLFFVRDPVKIIVKDAPRTDAKLRLHPSNDVGFREYHANGTFYIDREDASVLKKGELIRLKDLIGLRITAKADDCISTEISSNQEGKIMQWVSDGNYMKCSVMIPGELLNDDETVRNDSLKVAEGYVESYASKLKEREIVQFERFGYCVLDEAKSLRFIFISR